MLDLYYVSNKVNAPTGVQLYNSETIGRNVMTFMPYYNKPFICLTEAPYYFNYEAITDNVYKYNTIDNKNKETITSLYNPLTEENYPLVIKGADQEEVEIAHQNLNTLLEYDIQSSNAGYFVLSDGTQDWFTRGYILGFEKSMWQYDMGMSVDNVSIVFEDKMWTRIVLLDSLKDGTKITTDYANGVREFDLSNIKLERPCDFVIRIKPVIFNRESSYDAMRTRQYWTNVLNESGQTKFYGVNVAIQNNPTNDAKWDWADLTKNSLIDGRMGVFGNTKAFMYYSNRTEYWSYKWNDGYEINERSYYRNNNITPLGAHPYFPFLEIDTRAKTMTTYTGWLSGQEGERNCLDKTMTEYMEIDMFPERYNDTTYAAQYELFGTYEEVANADLSRYRKIIGDNNNKIRVWTFIEPREPVMDAEYNYHVPSISEFGRDVPRTLIDGSCTSGSSSDFKDMPYEIYIFDERRQPVWN